MQHDVRAISALPLRLNGNGTEQTAPGLLKGLSKSPNSDVRSGSRVLNLTSVEGSVTVRILSMR